MSISLQCPGCGKTLKGKEDLAGKRVKCPACGKAITLPPITRRGPSATLSQALERGDPAEIARFILKQDFTLLESIEHSDEDGKAAQMVEVDDFPAMLAFTSEDRAAQFAGAAPEMVELDEDGNVLGLVVGGESLLEHLPEGCGVLLDPESDETAVLPPTLVEQIKRAARSPSRVQAADPRAAALRQQVLQSLEGKGFRPARWLPPPDLARQVRPAREIAARLMALADLFTWASAPESAVASDSLRKHLKQNGLRDWLTAEEAEIVVLPRAKAQQDHGDNIGWKLENMWPLAWVLGFELEPTIEAAQIDNAVARAILLKFLPGLDGTVEQLVQKSQLRPAAAVIALEDRFYCAHNAVRSAQQGENTVPEGFHPVVHGGAVHERRHALTWCLSPGTTWDDTDLST
jgi:hypothetical protein